MKKLISLFLILMFSCQMILLIGCIKSPKLVNTESVGKIITANVIPTSFNESVKMKIETEQGVFIIYEITSVMKGTEVYILTYSDGLTYLALDGKKFQVLK